MKGGVALPPPASLVIAAHQPDPGFFLYYMDKAGQPQTDTWHLTLDDAFAQAEFEFGVSRDDWKVELGEGG